VYIEEQDGIQPIEGVSTSVTGFVGVTQRGPLDGQPPVLVTSFNDFQNVFGGYFTPSFSGGTANSNWPYNVLPHAVAGFFNNGGQILYVKRIAANPLPPFSLASAVILNGVPSSGTYNVGDKLTVSGGTPTSPTMAAVIEVATVSAGVITAVTFTPGSYTSMPPLTPNTPAQAVPASGSGLGATGATFNLTMNPTAPLAATSSEGLENSVSSPQILTRLAATYSTTSLTLQLNSLRGIQSGCSITLTQTQNGLTASASGTVASYIDAKGTVTLMAQMTPVAPTTTLPTYFDPQYTIVAVSAGSVSTSLTAALSPAPLTLQIQPNQTIAATDTITLAQTQAGTTAEATGTVSSYTSGTGLLTLTAALTVTPAGATFNPQNTTVIITPSPPVVITNLTAAPASSSPLQLQIPSNLTQPIALGDIITLAQTQGGTTTQATGTVSTYAPLTGLLTLQAALTVTPPGATFNPQNTTVAITASAPPPPVITTLAATFPPLLVLQSTAGIQVGTIITLSQTQGGLTTQATGTVASFTASAVTLTSAGVVAVSGSTLPATFQVSTTTVTWNTQLAFSVQANSSNFALTAANPGAWGNNIALQIQPSSRALANVVLPLGQSVSGGAYDIVTLTSTANFYTGAIVEFNLGSLKVYAKIQNIFGSSIQVTAVPLFTSTSLNPTGAAPTTARACEFDVLASYGSVSESFKGLTLDDTTPYFYATAINNGSSLLTVPEVTPPNAAHPYPCDDTTTTPSTLPIAADGLNVAMVGGIDGSYPQSTDYTGTDGGPGNRTGLAALVDVDQISIIAAPGVTDQNTQAALITQCETLKYRFAVLDPNPVQASSASPVSAIQSQRLNFDTKYAAIYFPSVVVDDPLTGNPLVVPPSGHMAGIYAQTDDSRGVWKAPANVVISGILGLETKVNKAEQEILNPEPNNICVLRDFTAQGRGRRVYGARCITSLDEWKYINVRRLFIFLEASLDQGTQWAVFEPNDSQLWNRLIQSVSAFLTTVWREGGLMGATAEQAFFVNCGTNTMSQDDIDNGRLIMVVGVAPVYPAEFVIIKIGQWAGGSSVQEL